MNTRPAVKPNVALLGGRALQWLSYVALAIISLYRAVLSPVLLSVSGPACRFEPTCSAYATQAISHYGIGRGGFMALKRLLKCHPLGGWGLDPVPALHDPNAVNLRRT